MIQAPCPRLSRLLACHGAVILLTIATPKAILAQNLFGDSGFSGQHGTYSSLPYEHVDPLSGNLIIVVTDLALPGNAGLGLRVTRTYNSKFHQDFEHGQTSVGERTAAGVGWRLHFGRVLHEESTQPGVTVVETPDGGGQPLYQQGQFPEGWMTKGFVRYNRSNHTARFPNGLVYTFGHLSESSGPRGRVRAVTAITDPFGNSLTFEYGGTVPGSVTRAVQDLGNGQMREVTFTYADNGALATMTYDGRTWTYEHDAAPGASGHTVLRRVLPPLGPAWEYQYANTGSGPELSRLLAPGGGYVDYTYATVSRRARDLIQSSRVVTQRRTGGFRITPGTWTFSYNQAFGSGVLPNNEDTTVVECPCGTTRYRFNGIGKAGDFEAWRSGTLAERTVEEGGVVLERELLTYQPSAEISPSDVPGEDPGNNKPRVWSDPNVYNALLATRTLTRGGSQAWTTTLDYHTTDFNDYGQAWEITETGEGIRRTNRTFATGFASPLWLVGRIASQSVTVIGTGTVGSSWTYDEKTGFLTRSNELGIQHDYVPTTQGNVLSVKNANNHTTTFSYAWGVSSGSVTPLVTTSRAINPDGSVASETVGSTTTSLTTLYEYDLVGRPRVIRPPGTNPIVYVYDGVYNEHFGVERGTSFTRTTLDGFGRAVSTNDAVALKTRVERDACGRVTFSSAPYTTGDGTRGTSTTYDALGRTRTVTAADGASVTRYDYPNGDVHVTNAAGHVTKYDYSGFSGPGERLVEVIDADDKVTSYRYDVLNNLTHVNGPGTSARERRWIYNDKGQLLEDTQPESGRTQYFYDPAGNLQRTVDALGRQTVFTYDANERLTNRDADGTDADVTIEYDVLGRVWRQTTDGIITTFTFDGSGRTASRTDAGIIPGPPKSSSYTYDANDNLQRITYPSTRQVTYQYDLQNRLTGVLNNGAAFAHNFHYDESGRLDSYFTGPVQHTVGYDVRDRVQQLTAGPSGNAALALTYGYNSISQVLSITDARPGMNQTFEYDRLDRLKVANGPWGQLRWSYDAQGNRLTEQRDATTVYQYDPSTQRLTSTSGASAESFGYNALGELTSDAFGSYTYSAAGMMRTASRGGMTASYQYDADHLRVKRQVNGAAYYTLRSVGGQVLSEHQILCDGAIKWVKDNIYAGSRLLGAVRNGSLGTPTFSFVYSGGPAPFGESAGVVGMGVKVVTSNGQPLQCAMTVSYDTVPGTATPNLDYKPAAGTLTFPAGTPNGGVQYISVELLTDDLDESDETLTVRLTGATGGALAEATSHPTLIQDDDATPSLTVSDVPVAETAGTATFRVSLSAMSGVEVRVNYITADQSAVAGSDYTAVNNTLVLAPNTPYADIQVPILDDSLAEDDGETFVLNLSAPVNATIADGQGVATIDDNERVPIDLSLTGPFFADVIANPLEPDFLVVSNLAEAAVTARLTFTRPDGSGTTRDLSIAGKAKVSIDVAAEAGLAGDVSVAVQSVNVPGALDGEHVAYWGSGSQGGRATEGVSPAPTWYFAEGSTGAADEWLTVFNPNPHPVNVTFDFFGNGLIHTRTQPIPHGPGRFKVRVADWLVGGPVDHGTRITGRTIGGALAPIVAERTMTWQADRREGHSTPGLASLATNWLFAEGDNGFFSTFIAVMNPNAAPLPLVLGYYHENGTLYFVAATVPALSRATLTPPAGLATGSFGVIVGTTSGLPFVAERSMYGGTNWTLGTSGVGASSANATWTLAEGETGAFWDTYVMVVNPNGTAANVTFAFKREGDPTPYYYGLAVPAYSRRTVWVNTLPGLENARFWTYLGSSVPVVVERATYWPRSSGESGFLSGGGEADTMSLAASEAVVVAQPSRDPARPTPIVPVELMPNTGLLRTPYDKRWPRAARPPFYQRVIEGTPANEAMEIVMRGAAPPTPPSDVGAPTPNAASAVSTPQSLSSGSTWYGAHVTMGRPR